MEHIKKTVRTSLLQFTIGHVKKELIECEPNKIIVGVSGGQDSIALLAILNILSHTLKFEIVACHINHGIREESKNEEIYVRELCRSLRIKCHVFHLEFGNGFIPNLADHARNLRKERFEQLLKDENADLIVLGHTKTDQVETMLMHMIRGCGMKGAEGMRITSTSINVGGFVYLRPFLHITRKDTLEICKTLNLKFVSDSSNDDVDKLRIMLRTVIIPKMEEFNGSVQNAFANFAFALQDTNDFISAVVRKHLENCKFEKESDLKIWNMENYKTLDSIIRTELIKAICQYEKIPNSEIRFKTIKNIEQVLLISNKERFGNPRKFKFANNVTMIVEFERLYFVRLTQ